MKFRQARHTHKLEPLVTFYTEIIGLKNLGSFENHQGYDGVFLGLEDSLNQKAGWHLEFTVSWEQPLHRPDEEDVLVFYPETKADYDAILSRIAEANIKPSRPKNPYWRRNGFMILDPDGFGVILVNPEAGLR